MADEQVPTPVPAPSQPVPAATPAPLTFLEKFQAPTSVLWNEYKGFLIVFGVLILIYKFREVIIGLLVADSKQEVAKDVKKDEQLQAKESQTNNAANQLIQEAAKLDENKPVVDENWNTKK